MLTCVPKIERGKLKAVDIRKAKYPIGPGDVLKFTVWPDGMNISGSYEVDDDGRIVVPNLGVVEILGMTTTQLRRYLKKKLNRYIRKASVSIILKEPRSKKVYILGAVKTQGVIFLRKPINVFDAIMTAGGPTPDAMLRRIFVVRGSLENPQVIPINFRKILKEGDMRENIALEPGDIVYVPTSFFPKVRDFLASLYYPFMAINAGTTAMSVLGIK